MPAVYDITMSGAARIPGAANVTPWELSDEKLLAECRMEAFVGPGPGGQKRHKTNAAVRYTHLPTHITATATDSRSQRENRIHALRNLRHKLALSVRREIDPISFVAPPWLAEYPALRINLKNPRYPCVVATVLDLLSATRWRISGAAAALGVTTNALVRFLHDDPPLWTVVNEARRALGKEVLSRR